MSIFGNTPQTQGLGALAATSLTSGNFNTAVGDLVVVLVQNGSPASTPAIDVTDSAGNIYYTTGRNNLAGVSLYIEWFYTVAKTASATNVISITSSVASGAGKPFNAFIWDFAITGGIPIFDYHTISARNTTPSGSISTLGFNTTGTDELILAGIYDTNGDTFTAGTGFTFNAQFGAGNSGDAEFGIFTNGPTTGQTASFNTSGTFNTGIMAISFRAASTSNFGGLTYLESPNPNALTIDASQKFNTATGDLLVVGAIVNASGVTISDTAGNTWVTLTPLGLPGGGLSLFIWYTLASLVKDQNDITLVSGGFSFFKNAFVYQFPVLRSAQVKFDVSATGTSSSSSSSITTASYSTTGSDEVVVAVSINGTGVVVNAATGYINDSLTSLGNQVATWGNEHRFFSSAQSGITTSQNFASSVTDSAIEAVAFKSTRQTSRAIIFIIS